MKIFNLNFYNKYIDKFRIISLIIFLILFPIAIYYALFNSPPDYQQGESVRIMYVHVPSAWLALGIYIYIAIFNISGFIWKNYLLHIFAISLAPIGASFAFICLVTGAIWGKPTWGVWWVWDARLTSMLILFFFYIGYIIVHNSVLDKNKADKIAAIIAILGFINIPIIKFSVNWWNSLHQDASILRGEGIAIDGSMLKPLFLMFISLIAYTCFLFATRSKTEILTRKIARRKIMNNFN